jgi:GT2 family glycosyltransferase
MERELKIGLVITAGSDRIDNLIRTLESVYEGNKKPEKTVIICDGWSPGNNIDGFRDLPNYGDSVTKISIPKHKPGKEQPRNIGVRYLQTATDCNYAWFLDSDCLVEPYTLEEYYSALNLPDYDGQDRILIGPVDYLSKKETSSAPHFAAENDFRWPIFLQHDYNRVHIGDVSMGLACISANIVWPIKEFTEIGGFWNELHHGRAEDGELGLRAVARGIPISLVRQARAFHIWHEGNNEITGMPEANQRKLDQNAIDVPKINERHAWIHDEGIHMVDKDGKRFDQICSRCGESVNTLLSWQHEEDCREEEYFRWYLGGDYYFEKDEQ